MKVLLRSTFIVNANDGSDKQLLLQNYFNLYDSGLAFEADEDIPIWNFIKNFVQAHNHIPEVNTMRQHFVHRGEDQVIGRLDALATIPAVTGGDFIVRLEDKAQDRRKRAVTELLKEAATIVTTGIEVKQGKETKTLHGPIDAVKHVLDRSHEIVTPTLGSRLSGEVTHDGMDFQREYERIKADPLAGIGQHTGLAQMDAALNGAKRFELWIHAAFTGHMKCVTGDTRIWDQASGCLRTVREIYDSRQLPVVHSLNQGTAKLEVSPADAVAESGVRPILKVQSENGREIRVSGNHPFLTPVGWVDAGNLAVGDWVGIPARLPNERTLSPFTDAEVSVLGYLLGDGTMASTLGLTNGNPQLLGHFFSCLHDIGYTEKPACLLHSTSGTHYSVYPKSGCNSTDVHMSRSAGDSKNHTWESPIRVLLDRLGLWGCKARDKFIPGELWQITDAQVWKILSALWATDGRVGVEKPRGKRKSRACIWYGSTSKQLCVDIQAFLGRLGVPSTVVEMPSVYKGTPYVSWVTTVVTNSGLTRFLTNTQIFGKEDAAKEALATLGGHEGDWVPSILLQGVPDTVRARSKSGGWIYARHIKRHAKVQLDTFKRLADAFGDPEILRVSTSDIRWEMVQKLVWEGEEMTYDLSVPGNANFVANGFITHNSTLMLNWAYNQAVWYYHSTLIFSLEMPYQQVRRLLYAIHSTHEKFKSVRFALGLQKDPDATTGLPYQGIRDGILEQYHDNAEKFLKDYVIPDFNGTKVVDGINPNTGTPWPDPQHYGKIHIEVPDPDKSDFTVADMRQRAELIHSKSPFRMIFVDHALLMAARKWVPSTTDRLNEVIRDLKRLAMSFNRGQGIGVVALFQLSRDGFNSAKKIKEKTGTARYELTSLSYANEAERSADIVTCSWKDDELANANRVQFQCLKSRDQKPFEIFLSRVEWSTRRLLTCEEVSLSPEQKKAEGDALDSLGIQ